MEDVPRGFRFAGVNAGIKAQRRDVALIHCDVPCVAAGRFTVNKARAAPVEHAARRLPASDVRAIVVNSGNANALTGAAGLEDVSTVTTAFANALGVPSQSVLSASTGVIGVRLPAHKLAAAAPRLKHLLAPSMQTAAEAILTTDTRIKIARRTLTIDGRTVRIAAISKGSGMIAPALATTLSFITTDLAIDEGALHEALGRAVEQSFHRLVIDGDMSTNDAVFVLASGLAGNAPVALESRAYEAFVAELTSLCGEVARSIAEDGEGATKLLTVEVLGAPSDAIAKDLSRAVASSSLVKTAVFGADPNWGRILATVGARAGSQGFDVDPARARVSIQGVCVYSGDGPTGADPAMLRARLRDPEVRIEITLCEGRAAATAWGCDLSYDYVKINADYMALTSASADGVVSRDDRLTNYSPGFKRALLVEALSYISRFAGKRAVIKYGGAAMVKDSLKASFASDVNLLRSAGLHPCIVHGGGPEITRTLEKLGGSRSEFVDGVRVTDASDVKVVEMVLTGRINTDIVSLINQAHAAAVGLSGKDAGLLRARKQLGEGGRDLGMVGEITSVNGELLEMMLSKYVPVISPVALGEDGAGYNINADDAAAEVAIAIRADKLIYLTDVAGVLEDGELVSELTTTEVRKRIESGTIKGGMLAKMRSCLRAIEGGVASVHVLDGRTPHGVIAELFTDRGVGTLIRPD